MQITVSTEGTRRVNPSVYFRPTAQPPSVSPASNRMIQAIESLLEQGVPDVGGNARLVAQPIHSI
jgi:hypothetical protein